MVIKILSSYMTRFSPWEDSFTLAGTVWGFSIYPELPLDLLMALPARDLWLLLSSFAAVLMAGSLAYKTSWNVSKSKNRSSSFKANCSEVYWTMNSAVTPVSRPIFLAFVDRTLSSDSCLFLALKVGSSLLDHWWLFFKFWSFIHLLAFLWA